MVYRYIIASLNLNGLIEAEWRIESICDVELCEHWFTSGLLAAGRLSIILNRCWGIANSEHTSVQFESKCGASLCKSIEKLNRIN